MFRPASEAQMLDLTTEKGRIISAALALAAERPWGEVTLADIAVRAGCGLVGLKHHFSTKTDVVKAFIDLVDDEVLRRAPVRSPEQAARDALFEVVMSRFDVLEPWKPAIRSIVKAGLPDPAQMAQALASNRWMLEAAGIGSGGLDGMARTAGLASVYATVFRTWLDDEDPGLARTMAALDRRLRRGEQALRRAEDAAVGINRFASAVFGAVQGVRQRMDEARRPSQSSKSSDEAPQPPGAV